MALDPNIILQAGNFKVPDLGDVLEKRAQIGLRNVQLARQQREDQLAQAKLVRLGDVGTQAAAGNLAGARSTALAGGDFDVLQHLDKLEQTQRETLQRRVDTAAPLAFEAAKLPYGQRKEFIAAQTPRLLANGWTPEELAKFDPTDQALGSIVASSQSIKDILDRQDKAADRTLRAQEAEATREFSRGNAYISAGLIPPGTSGSPGAPTTPGAGGPITGRTQFGWTPRMSAGGNNSDAAVDGKIGGMTKALGIDPDAPLTKLTPLQIAKALTLSEGGAGTLADRNNNPANLTDPKTGQLRRFPTKQAGLDAAAAQVQRNLARGQNTIRTMVEGLPVSGGAPATGTPGGLTPIPGGKLDKPKAARMTPEEVAAEGLDPNMVYYRGTDGKPEAVSGQSRASSLKAAPYKALTDYQENTAQMRTFQNAMRLLDPKNHSPQAKAARGAIGPGTGMLGDTITNYNDPKGADFRAMIGKIGGTIIKDISGAAVSASEDARLSKWVPQVTDLPEVAIAKLRNLQNAINNTQQSFESIYNEDNGYRPLKVRGTLAAPPGAGGKPPAQAAGAVPVMTPDQARNAPAGTRFKTTDGRVMVKK